MDFTKFSNSNFDAKMWINEAFHAPENLDRTRDQSASILVIKLQALIQEVNKSLEDISQQIVSAMPKTMRDLESLQHEALVLQSKMQSAQKDVQKIEQGTAHAMESLLKIDMARSRMTEVSNSLKEVDNWTSLTQGIDEIFQSGNPELISERLVKMSDSLSVLGSKVPDFKERSELLDRLKDQFVSLVSPSIIAALTSQNLDTVQYFVGMFNDLDRTRQLQDYYLRCIKSEVQRSWEGLLKQLGDNDVAEVLNSLYDSIITMWFGQLKWATHAFKNYGTVITEGLRSGLASLSPPIGQFVTENLSAYQDQLGALVRIKHMCENFARTMEANCGSTTPPADFKVLDEFLVEIYGPLKSLVQNYQNYEQSELLAKLNELQLDDTDMTELTQLLKNSSDFTQHQSLEAIRRCQDFTECFGLPGLVKALQRFYSNYMTKVNTSIDAYKLTLDTTIENWDQFEHAMALVHFTGKLFLGQVKIENELGILYVNCTKHLGDSDLAILDSNVEPESQPKSIAGRGRQPSVCVQQAFERVLLQSKSIKQHLQTFFERFKATDDNGLCGLPTLLPTFHKDLVKLNQSVHQIALQILTGPIQTSLKSMPKLPIWQSHRMGESASADLPSFSLVPQEYITKIGQYLMTFAHHLEPFLEQQDSALCVALQNYKLPHTEMPDCLTGELAARLWLESAGFSLMQFFCDAVLNIKELSVPASKQLLVDIGSSLANMKDWLRKVLVWLHLDEVWYRAGELRSRNRQHWRYHVSDFGDLLRTKQTPDDQAEAENLNNNDPFCARPSGRADERTPLIYNNSTTSPEDTHEQSGQSKKLPGTKLHPTKILEHIEQICSTISPSLARKLSSLHTHSTLNEESSPDDDDDDRPLQQRIGPEQLAILRRSWFQLAGRHDSYSMARRIRRQLQLDGLSIRFFDVWFGYQIFSCLEATLGNHEPLKVFDLRCVEVGRQLAGRICVADILNSGKSDIWDELAMSLAQFVRDMLPRRKRLWVGQHQKVWMQLFLRLVDSIRIGASHELKRQRTPWLINSTSTHQPKQLGRRVKLPSPEQDLLNFSPCGTGKPYFLDLEALFEDASPTSGRVESVESNFAIQRMLNSTVDSQDEIKPPVTPIEDDLFKISLIDFQKADQMSPAPNNAENIKQQVSPGVLPSEKNRRKSSMQSAITQSLLSAE